MNIEFKSAVGPVVFFSWGRLDLIYTGQGGGKGAMLSHPVKSSNKACISCFMKGYGYWYSGYACLFVYTCFGEHKHMSYFAPTPVLDFWWRLLWVWNLWNLQSLYCEGKCNIFYPRPTSGATPADLSSHQPSTSDTIASRCKVGGWVNLGWQEQKIDD